MRINVTKSLPSVKELAEVLRQEFSQTYSYKLFGLGEKSILVGKSTLVGAEITIRGNEVSIASSPPSFFAGLLHVFSFTELSVFFAPLFFSEGMPTVKTYIALEKEIGSFLMKKYS